MVTGALTSPGAARDGWCGMRNALLATTAAIAYMGPDWRTWRMPGWHTLRVEQEVRRRWVMGVALPPIN